MLDLLFFKISEYYNFFMIFLIIYLGYFGGCPSQKHGHYERYPNFSAHNVLSFCEICLSADFDTIDFEICRTTLHRRRLHLTVSAPEGSKSHASDHRLSLSTLSTGC